MHLLYRTGLPCLAILSGLAVVGTRAAPTAVSQSFGFGFSVLFGDSHSDYSNMYAYKNYTGMPGPPFYPPGRRSDGPMWSEYLNRGLDGLDNLNMAWEGAFLDNIVYGTFCVKIRVRLPLIFAP